MNKGIVYLIGAGPGDPGLFTLKGKALLENADVVIYDRLVGKDILGMARAGAELVYVGKESGRHALKQDEINALLVEQAKMGKRVVRLKGGDPFLYGRGGEEAVYVRENGLDYEVVPGITSAIAVPAYAGIPVTHREASSSFAIITGHEKPGKQDSSIAWDKISTGIGTLVFLMGVENLPFICSNLLENGRSKDTPVALIRWGTLPEQEVLTGTLQNIEQKVADTGFLPPAVIVVGDVVKLRDQLQWAENKPLWGKRIVVTRAREQASLLTRKIRDLGGIPLEFPTIQIVPLHNMSSLKQALKRIHEYQWIVFTSVNGVEIFFKQLALVNLDIRDLNGIKLCAIGPSTCENLSQRGLKVEVVPSEYRAEGIIEALQGKTAEGERVLLPRARGAREVLPDTLRQQGMAVDEIHLYEAAPVIPDDISLLDTILNGQVDYITFTSSSTVSNFVKVLGEDKIPEIAGRARVACIGPITADKAAEYGIQADVVAEEFTIDGLIQAILHDSALNRGEQEK